MSLSKLKIIITEIAATEAVSLVDPELLTRGYCGVFLLLNLLFTYSEPTTKMANGSIICRRAHVLFTLFVFVYV